MNFHGHSLPQKREARLRYLDADFQVLDVGDYVRCAISGDPIALDNLRYWNVDRQEPYKSAQESLAAERRYRLNTK